MDTFHELEDRFVAEDDVIVAHEDRDDPLGVFGRQSLETQLRGIGEDPKLTVRAQLHDVSGDRVSCLSFFPDNTNVSVGLRWEL